VAHDRDSWERLKDHVLREPAIIEGPQAIEAEFRRLEPMIRQGGCIICTDHQAAPHTPLEHYRFSVRRLREVMSAWFGEGVKTRG
jgi:hypothetical protein